MSGVEEVSFGSETLEHILSNEISVNSAEELSVVNSAKELQLTSNEISLRAAEGTLVPSQGTIIDDEVTSFPNGGGSTFTQTFVSTRFETHTGLFQEARSRSCSNDFISQMPDEILVMILSRFPIKHAVVTSILSTRWRFVWRNLIQLNFKGGNTERDKYINQVNSVIQSYNHQIIQDFRIHYNLNNHHKKSIDEWLQFAANKRVEFLELDFSDSYCSNMNYYEFPSRLFERNLSRSNAAGVVELVYLRKLVLMKVNLSEAVLQELLSSSPNLETLAIQFSLYLDHIRIGGRALNLKHFIISESGEHEIKSIHLSDFDLELFEYIGPEIDLRLVSLPKLKKVDMGYTWWPNDNVFDQLSSCASSLSSLSISLCRDENNVKPYSFRELPNVKQLRMKLRGRKHNCLLDLASIVNACPNMESFKIETCWTAPIVGRRKARDATISLQHLKLFEIMPYYGRKCDFELAVYIIQTAVALEKIVITTSKFKNKIRGAARSSAKRLESILPRGVKLITL